ISRRSAAILALALVIFALLYACARNQSGQKRSVALPGTCAYDARQCLGYPHFVTAKSGLRLRADAAFSAPPEAITLIGHTEEKDTLNGRSGHWYYVARERARFPARYSHLPVMGWVFGPRTGLP